MSSKLQIDVYPVILKILTCYHVNLGLVIVISHQISRISIGSTSWFQEIKLQTTLLLFDGCTTLTHLSRN